ncbi:putative 60S ribosomal protein L14 [Monoraphidium neglectum]|uniref:Putative 60S ribosomal protein L14 n=1 Tax=Monoraphidium neglectum TaxID=145388 RepID=A0A0D2JGT4_9CHLO|nr:putative 60S ribosomal protein L14 [Monoraphidium neglectum]KIY98607.1 putative 60S ribosomal protein L14 [Monoraphidium neglectum]|eukprot:XP_013897627.1 putative 60S ribosomal protein L14 [Monoraphidium neglectum]
MPFKRYVEIGRVAIINYGPEVGKLVVISDVVDQNRALVDAPGFTRRVETFKRLTLTDFKLDIPRLAAKKVVNEKWAADDINGKFDATAWGKKLKARADKAAQSDFDRYKAAVAKSKKGRLIRAAVNKLKK